MSTWIRSSRDLLYYICSTILFNCELMGSHIVMFVSHKCTAEMDYVRITVQAQSSGSTATVCIDVTILDDSEYEGREEFSVVFTLVASGDSCTSQVEITDFEDLQGMS